MSKSEKSNPITRLISVLLVLGYIGLTIWFTQQLLQELPGIEEKLATKNASLSAMALFALKPFFYLLAPGLGVLLILKEFSISKASTCLAMNLIAFVLFGALWLCYFQLIQAT